ncbi:MAG: 2,3,4,5-tetrahydropyridine-2,6-dicarboxylate N-succinyltransferase, partial [Bdellovibrionales bacterium]
MGLAAMKHSDDLQTIIEAGWEARADLNADTKGDLRDAVETALAMLDSGQARIAERRGVGDW